MLALAPPGAQHSRPLVLLSAAPHTPQPPAPPPCPSSSLERLDAEMSAQVAALAGEGPTADELRRYKKASTQGRITKHERQCFASRCRVAKCASTAQAGAGQVQFILSVAPVLSTALQSARVELLGALGSNSAVAAAMASYQVWTGGRIGAVPISTYQPSRPLAFLLRGASEAPPPCPAHFSIPAPTLPRPVPQLTYLAVPYWWRVHRAGPAAHFPDPFPKSTSLTVSFCSVPSPTQVPPILQALTGDWRNVLADLQSIEDLSSAEARDVAARWLRPDNLFRGYVLPA